MPMVRNREPLLMTKTLRATELDRGQCLRREDGFLWRASIFFVFEKKERGLFLARYGRPFVFLPF